MALYQILVWTGLLAVTMVRADRWYDQLDRNTRSKAARVLEELDQLLKDREQILSEKSARLWLEGLEPEFQSRTNKMSTLAFNYGNNLTDYNEQLLHDASAEYDAWIAPIYKQAKIYVGIVGAFQNETLGWLFTKLLNGACLADDQNVNNQMSKLGSQLSSIYAKATVTHGNKTFQLEPDLAKIMAESRDYDERLWAWRSWRDATGPHMRAKYAEKTRLMNIAARDSNFTDIGQAWRISNFDQDNIEPMVDKLYKNIKPLYKQLHAYVRRKLIKAYPNREIDPEGPIPAHLLGGMWAQHWTSLLDIVVPYPGAPTYDVTARMKEKKFTVPGMFKQAEQFFTSLGLESMTQPFWKNSVMERPSDRDIVCHASAWDFYTQDDFRIKMCGVVNMEYLQVIHHEMGHVEYYMQYREKPTMFRGGANSAFHEAVGDTIALSVMTPQHLEAIDLLDEAEQENDQKAMGDISEGELNFLMKMALEKVAFLPFGYMMDKYRWDLFRGYITEQDYNHKWWLFREKYQGVEAPIPRTEQDFDPGSKYHIAASVPYIRYFLSFIGQFQFQEALCNASRHEGPLHKCDIYKSTEAGDRLKSALSLGASVPWRDVMEVFTGQREFSSDAILKYFKPLQDWLEEQNKNEHIGW